MAETQETTPAGEATIGERLSHFADGRGLALLLGLASKLQCGSLELHLPDGTEQLFHGPQPGPHGVMRLRSGRVARRYLTGGSLGFAESFIDGDWDTPDLSTLLALLSLNEEAWGDGYFGSLWHRGLRRQPWPRRWI